ncbi:MAG: ATP-binding protein [Anaerolineae bacterium]|nr:ATP-binding protein [Anaerolineae bacterium]
MIITERECHSSSGTLNEKSRIEQIYAALSLSTPMPANRLPVLLILTGLPGSGKTHLASLLRAKVPFSLICSDSLRAVLVDRPDYSPSENSLVYRLADKLLWRLLRERRNVIYDAVNLSEGRRQTLRTLALDAGARPMTILVTASEHVIRERLARRRERTTRQWGDSQADWDVYCKLASLSERIAHQHIVVDTTQDIAPSLPAIIEAIAMQSGPNGSVTGLR